VPERHKRYIFHIIKSWNNKSKGLINCPAGLQLTKQHLSGYKCNDIIKLHFNGRTCRSHDEIICIVDTICNYEHRIRIKGVIESLLFYPTNLTLSASLGKTAEGEITLTNPTNKDITISSAPTISDNRFEINASQFPITIPAGKK